jgi:hypothetical protein
VHNLEALLRSERVSQGTIRELIPELRAGGDVLRQAFLRARLLGGADARVGEHGGEQVKALARLFDEVDTSIDARARLAAQAGALAEELEASADLLALLERSSAPSITDVSVNLIVRETGRLWGSGRGKDLSVLFDPADPDGLVTADPYVVGPLLALVVAWVHASGAARLAVRARSAPPLAVLVVEAAGPADPAAAAAARPALPMRVMTAVPPTPDVARRVAERIGAILELGAGRGSIALPLATG